MLAELCSQIHKRSGHLPKMFQKGKSEDCEEVEGHMLANGYA